MAQTHTTKLDTMPSVSAWRQSQIWHIHWAFNILYSSFNPFCLKKIMLIHIIGIIRPNLIQCLQIFVYCNQYAFKKKCIDSTKKTAEKTEWKILCISYSIFRGGSHTRILAFISRIKSILECISLTRTALFIHTYIIYVWWC